MGAAILTAGPPALAQEMTFFRIASGKAVNYYPMVDFSSGHLSSPGARTCGGGNRGMEGLVVIAQSAHGSVANVNSLKSDRRVWVCSRMSLTGPIQVLARLRARAN